MNLFQFAVFEFFPLVSKNFWNPNEESILDSALWCSAIELQKTLKWTRPLPAPYVQASRVLPKSAMLSVIRENRRERWWIWRFVMKLNEPRNLSFFFSFFFFYHYRERPRYFPNVKRYPLTRIIRKKLRPTISSG